jgi:parallel beta-helix repeat protein
MKPAAPLCLSLLLLTAFPISHALAQTVWVDRNHPACSDAGTGTETVPYCTIGAAVTAQFGGGKTIRVKPGEYTESVSIPRSGGALRADGPGVVVNGSIGCSGRTDVTIDGFRAQTIGLGGGANITLTNNTVIGSTGPYGISVSNLLNSTIANNHVANCVGPGFQLRDLMSSVVQDNVAEHNQIGMNFPCDLMGSHNNRIQRNRVFGNLEHGMYFQTMASNNVCIQNVIWGNGDHGIVHKDGSVNCRHIGEVVWGNVDDGVSIRNASTGISFSNCILVNNGLGLSAYNVYVDSTSTTGFASDDNVIWNSNGQKVFRHGNATYTTLTALAAAVGLDTRSAQADPRFADAPGGQFQVLAGSPAIDCANSSVADFPALDGDGHARVDDAGMPNVGVGPVAFADRGAFEYDPATLAVGEVELSGLALAAVTPNPARAGARFAFRLPAAADVRLTVVDLQGRIVAVVADGRYGAGRHDVAWDGRASGAATAPGLYFLRLRTAGATISRRFTIAR